MMNLVKRQLSCPQKKNNGVVEVEASDNEVVIETHKKQIEENRSFSNVFMKEIKQENKKNNTHSLNNVSYLGKKNFKDEKKSGENLKLLQNIEKQLDSLRKEMNNMILTDQSGISDELSYQTPIKLRQEKTI